MWDLNIEQVTYTVWDSFFYFIFCIKLKLCIFCVIKTGGLTDMNGLSFYFNISIMVRGDEDSYFMA